MRDNANSLPKVGLRPERVGSYSQHRNGEHISAECPPLHSRRIRSGQNHSERHVSRWARTITDRRLARLALDSIRQKAAYRSSGEGRSSVTLELALPQGWQNDRSRSETEIRLRTGAESFRRQVAVTSTRPKLSRAVLPGRLEGLMVTAAAAPSRAACRDGWQSLCDEPPIICPETRGRSLMTGPFDLIPAATGRR